MDSTREPLAGNRTPERWNIVPIPERVAARAYANIDKAADGCWISRYSTASHGYAQVGWNDGPKGRHMVLAHRAAWVHVNGQVPIGMTIDHLCKTRRCVNPDHLRLLPNYENARRVGGRDWPMGQCANGHTNAQLKTNKRVHHGKVSVGMICAECRRIYAARNNWRTRHPGEPIPDALRLASERETA